jgi:hypothetical protein
MDRYGMQVSFLPARLRHHALYTSRKIADALAEALSSPHGLC